ncbi:MAG: PRC-barrel domain-containing protein [Thermosynechococcaceae cyanobacterium]
MSQSSLQRSALHNQMVLDRQTSEKVGHLSELLLDSPSQRIVGFQCGGGLLGGPRQTFSWSQIESIGADSIVISGQQWEPDFEGTGPIKVPIGHEVWSDTGNQMGKIKDLLFDPDTGKVISYIFTAKGWQSIMDGTYLLPCVAVSSIGSKRVIALESMVNNPQQYQEGLGQKAGQVTDFLKADYEQTKQDLAAMKTSAQGAMEQVKEVLPGQQDLEAMKTSAQNAVEQVKGSLPGHHDQSQDRVSEEDT